MFILNKTSFKRLLFTFLIISLFKPTWLLNNESLSVGSDDLSYWLHSSTLAFDYDLNYVRDFNLKYL